MPAALNLTGRTFGSARVLERTGKSDPWGYVIYHCRGECTPEYAEQLIREAEQRAEQLSPTAIQIPDWLMQPQIPLLRNTDDTANDA